jgi:hypothetical protein
MHMHAAAKVRHEGDVVTGAGVCVSMPSTNLVHATVKFVPIGTHRHTPGGDAGKSTSLSLSLSVAFVVCATVSATCLFLASLVVRPIDIPSWVDADSTAKCLRSSRESNFATVALSVGTPPRIVRVLLRGGEVQSSDMPSTTLFADELLRSESLRCGADRVCHDAAVLTSRTDGMQSRHVVQFIYGSAASGMYGTEQENGAEGFMRFEMGTYYELTTTHLCWTRSQHVPAPSSFEYASPLSVKSETGLLSIALPTPLETPANRCFNSTPAVFWPLSATNEQTWLALSSDFLFEASSSKLDERREIVERGLNCLDNMTSGIDVYELDCTLDVYATCRHESSVTFRRLSQMSLALDFRNGVSGMLYASKRQSLSHIAGSSVSESVLFAFTRLVVLLIVAFVVYSRSDRQSTSAFFAIKNALKIASGDTHSGFHSVFNALIDAFVGALAFTSRLVVLTAQSGVLIGDSNITVVVSESLGVVTSFVHFILRNFVLRTDLSKESPLTKLGGSMAIVDASLAALLSVTVTPIVAASSRNFDSVSRLFCGVLVVFFVLPRVWAGSAASALLARTASSDRGFDAGYPFVLWSASVLWILQSACVSISLARLFVVPQAYSLSRNMTGNGTVETVLVSMVSLALVAPPLNAMSVRLKTV